MKPEDIARQSIDRQLKAAGWLIQDVKGLNLGAGLGVAVREFPLKGGKEADYLLFVDRKAVGVVEAKKKGMTLSGVADQTETYLAALPENLPHVQEPLPFAYETTGVETLFRDIRDPDPRSRRVFMFHRPETLAEWAERSETLRARLRGMPALVTTGLRACQIEAIRNLEKSFTAAHPRALIQMATGSGKTFTAVSSIYRLLKFADARRVLFLVDRRTLGRQTLREFQGFETPDDGRKFTELYNVQHMTTNALDRVSRVCITTIQRLFSMLRGEEAYEDELEEHSAFDVAPMGETPKEVVYNPSIPIETFDFIVTDECHRSIYNLWRQVLEYFDSFLIGLTATPSKQTLGFFNRNLVMEYSHERAVADGVNVGYEVYRIDTAITERGSKVDAGFYVDKRDKLTRALRWEQLDEDLEYASSELDRAVVAHDQIRTVIRTFREKLFTEIFPGRTDVPKTLIFAKDDSHAEDIVHILRDEFGQGNEFCKKITYKTTGEKPENLIASFRNSYNPRIAVTVDMISTGTDVRPLECLLFMRKIRSQVYFDQMKGRGTRVISPDEIQSVTPGVKSKTHFVIVDAVGVCEDDKTETRPLERKRSVPFEKLLLSVAMGSRDEDTLTSLAGRLARLEQSLDEEKNREIETAAGGVTFQHMVHGLLDSVDPDKCTEKAVKAFDTKKPTEEEFKKARKALADEACKVFDDPKLRDALIEAKRLSEQIIDTVSQDAVLFAGYSEQARERARGVVDSFKKFIEENRDELTALQIFYSVPYGQRHLTYNAVRELAKAMEKPPYHLTTEVLWKAYEQLEKSKVRRAGPQKLLADIVSLVRFAIGEAPELAPWAETVDERFEAWLRTQEQAGRSFTPEQREWLVMIKSHIATSLSISVGDLEDPPFHEKGGPVRAQQVFGGDVDEILKALNEALAA